MLIALGKHHLHPLMHLLFLSQRTYVTEAPALLQATHPKLAAQLTQALQELEDVQVYSDSDSDI